MPFIFFQSSVTFFLFHYLQLSLLTIIRLEKSLSCQRSKYPDFDKFNRISSLGTDISTERDCSHLSPEKHLFMLYLSK